MTPQFTAMLVLVLFGVAYLAAESYVRSARARDSARARAAIGESTVHYRVVRPDDRSDLRLTHYPTGSGPGR